MNLMSHPALRKVHNFSRLPCKRIRSYCLTPDQARLVASVKSCQHQWGRRHKLILTSRRTISSWVVVSIATRWSLERSQKTRRKTTTSCPKMVRDVVQEHTNSLVKLRTRTAVRKTQSSTLCPGRHLQMLEMPGE